MDVVVFIIPDLSGNLKNNLDIFILNIILRTLELNVGVHSASILRIFCFKTIINARDFHIREEWRAAYVAQANLGFFICLKLNVGVIMSLQTKSEVNVFGIDTINHHISKLEAAVWGACSILEETKEERNDSVSLGLYLTFAEAKEEWVSFSDLILKELCNGR